MPLLYVALLAFVLIDGYATIVATDPDDPYRTVHAWIWGLKVALLLPRPHRVEETP